MRKEFAMSDTVPWIFVFALTCAIFGWASEMDSVPAAITVYRNPEFFRNLARVKEKKDEDNSDEEEDREDLYDNNEDEFHANVAKSPRTNPHPGYPGMLNRANGTSEMGIEFLNHTQFHSGSLGRVQEDFEDGYKYPGEPKKPNPGSGPDFTTYYDESPEFVPEPRDIKPSGSYTDEEEEEEREGNELNKEEQEEGLEQEEEEDEKESTSSSSKYHVPMDKSLEYRVPSKLYEESRQYHNPVFKTDMTSFDYPSSFADLDYYSYPSKEKYYTDNKKGTREYLRDHSVEEIDDPNPGNVRADSKHVFRTISKFGIKPVFYVPYVPHKIKAKYKLSYKPKKIKWRAVREIPDDSAYQLSSDYDSDFEFV